MKCRRAGQDLDGGGLGVVGETQKKRGYGAGMHGLVLTHLGSVVTVMTNFFQIQNHGIYMPKEFSKIMRIFDKIDDANDEGVISSNQLVYLFPSY
jgi:hypothetical protein